MSQSQRSRTSRLTGFDLFHQALAHFYLRRGYSGEGALVAILDAYLGLSDEMVDRIQGFAARDYTRLPRTMVDYFCRQLNFDPNESASGSSSPPVSPGQQKRDDSSSADGDDANPGAPTANMQQPPAENGQHGSLSDSDLLIAALTPVVCAGSCFNKDVRGSSFALMAHPSIRNVYIGMPMDIFQQSDVPPISVPLVKTTGSDADFTINGTKLVRLDAAARSPDDGSRLEYIYTKIDQTAALLSVLIKVVKGTIYIYDVSTGTWQRLWGPGPSLSVHIN